jgi:hypothetical protein
MGLSAQHQIHKDNKSNTYLLWQTHRLAAFVDKKKPSIVNIAVI